MRCQLGHAAMRGRAQTKMAAQGGIAARLHPDIEAAASDFLDGIQQPCAGRQFGHLGRLRQCLGSGMHGLARQQGGQRQQLISVLTFSRCQRAQHQAVARQRSGLVEHQRIHGGQRLQPLQIAHQHAAARQGAGRRQHGHGRGQRKRTGTGDDEHGHGHHHGLARVGGPPPDGGGQRRQQHHDEKRPGHLVGQLGQGWLLQRSAFHQIHDLRKAGALTHAVHSHLDNTVQVVAAGGDCIALCAQNRRGLASQKRLIGMGGAAQNPAVCGESLAREHTHHITHTQAARGHTLELSRVRLLTQHRIRQPVHHGFQCTGRAVAQAQLQPAPREQEEDKHGQRVEEDFLTERTGGIKSAQRADDKGDQHAQGHGQVHAHAALGDVLERALEERAATKQHHGQRNHPGCPAQQGLHLQRQVAGPRRVGGPCIHHHLHHAQAGHQPAPQGTARLGLAQLARKCVARGQGAIAGTRYGLHPLRWKHLGGTPLDTGSARCGTDFGCLHSGDSPKRLLDGQRTCSTVHALQNHKGIPHRGLGCVLGDWSLGALAGGATKRAPFLRIVQQMTVHLGQVQETGVSNSMLCRGRLDSSVLGHVSSVTTPDDTHLDINQPLTAQSTYACIYNTCNLRRKLCTTAF